MTRTRASRLASLTPEGQRLFLYREKLGLSNDLCPLCEDEESCGEPCEACIQDEL